MGRIRQASSWIIELGEIFSYISLRSHRLNGLLSFMLNSYIEEKLFLFIWWIVVEKVLAIYLRDNLILRN